MAETSPSSHDVPPVWLNTSFMEKALRSGEGEDPNLTVTSVDTKRATAAGENYSSAIFRISVQFSRGIQRERKTVIIKTLPKNEELSRVILETNVFEREGSAFTIVIPELYRLLNGLSRGMFQPFSAKCIYSSNEPPAPVIILEDLKEQGFRMVDRALGLDMNHCLLVIRTLAQYHASSVVLNQKKPEIFNALYTSIYNEDFRKELEVFYKSGMKNLANEIEKWPDYKDRFADKFHKLSEIVYDRMISITAQYNEDFNVFLHGDIWTNNIMFRYAEGTGEVQDVRFMDLQICRFGNPAQDILYFLYTSPSFSLLHKYDTLIEEYYKVLKETLELFGCYNLCPSMEQLHKQIEKIGLFAVIVTGVILPVILVDRTNIPNTEKLLKNEESVRYSEKFKEAFMKLLPLFEKKGWL